ncbi:hypothetical protein OG225_42020 (plasmid) [Nocardia sp. NBC_01377]|uniref:hypothetical protein n=1 Tax=Nocardia sp. NBC_01377 TaxID=2903595 RepID=UPI00324A18ED
MFAAKVFRAQVQQSAVLVPRGHDVVAEVLDETHRPAQQSLHRVLADPLGAVLAVRATLFEQVLGVLTIPRRRLRQPQQGRQDLPMHPEPPDLGDASVALSDRDAVLVECLEVVPQHLVGDLAELGDSLIGEPVQNVLQRPVEQDLDRMDRDAAARLAQGAGSGMVDQLPGVVLGSLA